MFVHKNLSHKGKFTGGLYGFIKSMTSAIIDFKIDRVIVVNDKKPYFKESEYKKYKTNRKPFEPDVVKKLIDSKVLIKEFITTFNIPYYSLAGWEADDIVAQFCKTRAHKYKSIYILSNDSDLYQLFQYNNVFLCGSDDIYGAQKFRQEWPGLEPKDWAKVIAIAGSHNNVPGIPSVGSKTAYGLLVKDKLKFSEIEKLYEKKGKELKKNPKQNKRSKKTNKEVGKEMIISSKKKNIKHRLRIATLPYNCDQLQDMPVIKAKRASITMEDFKDFLLKYKIKYNPMMLKAIQRIG